MKIFGFFLPKHSVLKNQSKPPIIQLKFHEVSNLLKFDKNYTKLRT
jgi:hypothetical protein